MSGKETQYKLMERYQVDRFKHLMDSLDLSKENEKEIFKTLMTLKNTMKKGVITVKYDYKIKIGTKRFGRMYPTHKSIKDTESIPCYLTLESTLRDFLLAGSNYAVVDISNCHATIVKCLFDHHNIECASLNSYNKNRKTILERYGCEKELIGKCLNYDGFTGFQFKNQDDRDFFLSIKNAVFEQLFPKLKESAEFKELYEYELSNPKKKENFDIKNTFVSLVYQTIESTFIKFAIDYFSQPALGLSVDALFHDGILISGLNTSYLSPDKWNEEINAQFNKYYPYIINLRLSPKEFAVNEQLQKIFDREPIGKSPEEKQEICSDRDVAKSIFDTLILKEYLFKYNGDVWIYDITDNLWKNGSMRELIEKELQECDLIIKGGIAVKENTKNWCHYFTQFRTFCSSLVSDEKKGLLLDSIKDVIPYENGFLDLKRKVFIDHQHSTESHLNYFTMCCARKYNGNVDSATYNRVKSLFLDIFNGDEASMGEVFSFYMRALSGHVEDKVFLTECGLRNSGKGFKIDALLAAFPGLASTFSPDELYSNNTYDAERRMGFAIEFTSKRLMLGSEIPSSVILDGTLIKSLASGGDRLSGRKAYGRAKTGTVKSLFSLSCQVLPECRPANALQTMLHFDMPCKFYSSEELEELKKSNTGCLAVAKLADPGIKNESKTDEFINALTKLLIGYYSERKPAYKILSKGTAELMENSESVFDTRVYFDQVFEKKFVRDPTARVNCTVFHSAFRHEKFDIETSARTVSKYFKTNHGLEQRKSNGVKFYVGIRPTDDVSDF